MYLRALRTLPNLDIIFGHFLSHAIMMPLASPPKKGSKYIRVIKTEEKGSDVKIATHMVNDGHNGEYKVAVIVSNDSDLAEPVRIVRNELNLPVGVLNPIPKHPSYELRKQSTFFKPIRKGALAASQFPVRMTDGKGKFHKPREW